MGSMGLIDVVNGMNIDFQFSELFAHPNTGISEVGQGDLDNQS